MIIFRSEGAMIISQRNHYTMQIKRTAFPQIGHHIYHYKSKYVHAISKISKNFSLRTLCITFLIYCHPTIKRENI